MADSAIQETVNQAEAYSVDPQLCIACDACCDDFPEVFFMGTDEKAHPVDSHPTDLYNARVVVDVCPTAAIDFSGEIPPPEDLGKLEEVPGWELEWANWRGVEQNITERDRRYGRDYDVEHEDGYIRVVFRFPTRVPAVRDRFRYGLVEEMPIYRHHAQLQGNSLVIAGWQTDPKIRSLCHTSQSFPSQFVTNLDFDAEIIDAQSRFDAHSKLEIILFTDPAVRDTWQWRSHFITEDCTSCSICERVCPTNAITSGEIYYIDPDLCINCSVCGVYCPFDAIDDNDGALVQRIKNKKIPKAVVHEDSCTGCEFCVDICPFDALVMVPAYEGLDLSIPLPQTSRIAKVIDKLCVSCKLCEQVCIKDAVEVPRQHQFEDIGMSFMSYVTDPH